MTESFGLPRASTRLLDLWGHWSASLLVISIAASICLGLRTAAPSTLSLLATLTLFMFVLTTWGMMRQHDRRLCTSCAAAIPLNAAEQASRYRRRFVVTHALSNPRILIPYLIVLLGSNWFLTFSGSSRYIWAAVQATMIYLVLSHSAHRRLQPWCPWCSGGGGGGEWSPVNSPDGPRGGRQLV